MPDSEADTWAVALRARTQAIARHLTDFLKKSGAEKLREAVTDLQNLLYVA